MEYMFMPLRRYFDFSGRSRRKEYWMWTLFVVIVEVVLYSFIIGAAVSADGQMTAMVGLPFMLLMVFALAIMIPAIAVTIRRLHDQDKSGAYFLLIFIPLVGPIVLLVFMCMEGTPGPNQYGPDPKAHERMGGGPGYA
ncbi:MAG TPA: DUF805 domain-containing protein [Allosphingosinicella sp.]|jgi:uncharacterized membrane protein YhaH (DUF805 family)